MIFGIVAILIATLAMLGCAMAALQMFVINPPDEFEAGAEMARIQVEKQVPAAFWTSLAMLPLNTFLLILGIGAIKRLPWIRKGFITWACVVIPISIVTLVINSTINLEVADAMTQFFAEQADENAYRDDKFYDVMGTVTKSAMYVGIISGAAWQLGPPIFAIVWFRRAKIIDEIKTWDSRPTF